MYISNYDVTAKKITIEMVNLIVKFLLSEWDMKLFNSYCIEYDCFILTNQETKTLPIR